MASPTTKTANDRATEIANRYGRFMALVRVGTGLSFRTVWTWVAAESGPVDNPLNLGPGNSYGSPARAAAATIATLRNPRTNRTYGYDKIIASANKNDSEQLKAIANSSWDAGHYQNGELLRGVYQTYFPKTSGGGFFDWVGQTVTDPGQSLSDAGQFYEDKVPGVAGLTAFLGNLLSGAFWVRVLLVVFGGVALIGAMVILSRELAK